MHFERQLCNILLSSSVWLMVQQGQLWTFKTHPEELLCFLKKIFKNQNHIFSALKCLRTIKSLSWLCFNMTTENYLLPFSLFFQEPLEMFLLLSWLFHLTLKAKESKCKTEKVVYLLHYSASEIHKIVNRGQKLATNEGSFQEILFEMLFSLRRKESFQSVSSVILCSSI